MLAHAIENPEYMLTHWIALPTVAPSLNPASKKKASSPRHLALREAILLALRYNPNIQNAELDRIIQRYQLRLAHNEFELQYALAGIGSVQKSRYSGIGSDTTTSFLASPEMALKTQAGTKLSLNLDNTLTTNYNYFPTINFTLTQPLLRGFGKDANNSGLLNAIDSEWLNKIILKQTVIDQITQVILTYRGLIMSANNLQNQKRQLEDARRSFEINEKKIEAGQLAPTGNIQASYQIESLNLMVTQAENDFNTASQNLLQMIGLDPNLSLSIPDNVVVNTIKVPNLKQTIDTALAHNSQFLAQKMALRADTRAYKVAKNQQRWQLDLVANGKTGQVNDVTGAPGLRGIYNGQNMSESLSLNLTVPLHDLNRRSQLINAKVRLEKDRVNLIAMRRALITSITNMISTIQSQAKRYQLAEKQVLLAKKSYELEKKKQEAGISSGLDVNNTQNQLIQAEANLIGAKIAYLNEISSLERLLGTTLDAWGIKLGYGA